MVDVFVYIHHPPSSISGWDGLWLGWQLNCHPNPMPTVGATVELSPQRNVVPHTECAGLPYFRFRQA